jgi:hypothetical protein
MLDFQLPLTRVAGREVKKEVGREGVIDFRLPLAGSSFLV